MKSFAALVCVMTMYGSLAIGAETASKSAGAKGPPQLTIEQRQKMADLHDKMAACLRSDRPLSDCHQDMMKGCTDAMGKDGCSMMGGKMGHGMRHHMMDQQSTGKE